MTPETQVALISAMPPTLAALGAFVAVLIVDRRSDRKLNHITVLTNSTLAAANKRIEDLEEVVRRLVAERDA